MAARDLRPAANIDRLAIGRAAEAVAVAIVIADLEESVMTAPIVAPIVVRMGTAAFETVIIGLVDITPVLAIEVASETRADGTAENDAGDRAARAPLRRGISQQRAEDAPDDSAAHRIVLAAVAVERIVRIHIIVVIVFAPILLGAITLTVAREIARVVAIAAVIGTVEIALIVVAGVGTELAAAEPAVVAGAALREVPAALVVSPLRVSLPLPVLALLVLGATAI